MKFEIKHRFPVNRECYLAEVYFHPEMNDQMDRAMKFKERIMLAEEENDEIHRKVQKITPERDLPAILQKATGGKSLGYIETTVFYKKKYLLDWAMKTEMMPETIYGGGTVRFYEEEGEVVRHVEGELTVKIFAVGSMVERIVVDSIKDSYEMASRVTRAWIAEHYPTRS